jgi:hypothetical protein
LQQQGDNLLRSAAVAEMEPAIVADICGKISTFVGL